MSYPEPKFHEMVFQLLFSFGVGGCQEEELISLLMRELTTTRKNVRRAFEKAQMVFAACAELDQKIAATSEAYALERIGRVERTVLRLALFELSEKESLPKEVIIAEALRLTRKFSTKEATTFVNALLDIEECDESRVALCPQDQSTAE